jgi:hypothetical protein
MAGSEASLGNYLTGGPIEMKTTGTPDLTNPLSLLLRADQVIE